MKKILCTLSVLLFVFALAGTGYASVDARYEAAVVDMNGDVMVDPDADGTWFEPWVGMKLKVGAVLKTGEGAGAQLVFDEDGLNVLSVDENSRLTVKKSMVDMPEGAAVADFANLSQGSSFVVKTPGAACGIRGSRMVVIYRDNELLVMALEDDLYVWKLGADGNPQGAPTVLPEGRKTYVGPNGQLLDIQDITGDDIEDADDMEDEGGTEEGEELAGETEEPEVDSKDLDEQKEISPSQ
ncbi:MAG: hypothetical protein GF392_02690 [Candidatus Omnitrophica bacterium]|nr:hypothetical protein [Candidatus Omnitrophota bacterium]